MTSLESSNVTVRAICFEFHSILVRSFKQELDTKIKQSQPRPLFTKLSWVGEGNLHIGPQTRECKHPLKQHHGATPSSYFQPLSLGPVHSRQGMKGRTRLWTQFILGVLDFWVPLSVTCKTGLRMSTTQGFL